jgi:hypothetical protein
MTTSPAALADVRVEHAPVPAYEFEGHRLTVTRGHPLPLGASHTPGGVNFVLLCRYGTAVTLVLSEPCNPEISAEIPLDPRNNRTGDHWHIRLHGLPAQKKGGLNRMALSEAQFIILQQVVTDPRRRNTVNANMNNEY